MRATAKQIAALAGGKSAKPPRPLEKDVQSAVIEYLVFIGAKVIRINSGGIKASYNGRERFIKFNSEPGCSDLLAVMPDGRFAAWECKRPGFVYRPPMPGEELSKERRHIEEQAAFLASVRQRGGIAAFVTGIDDVKQVLLSAGDGAG